MIELRKENLRNHTIALFLEMRKRYLLGTTKIGFWEYFQNIIQEATSQASSVEDWYDFIIKQLGIKAPNKELAYELHTLKNVVDDEIEDWLTLVKRENYALLARTRALVDVQKENQKEQPTFEGISISFEHGYPMVGYKKVVKNQNTY